MTNWAFTFFAITLGTISVALAVLLACMVMQGDYGSASASPHLFTHYDELPWMTAPSDGTFWRPPA